MFALIEISFFKNLRYSFPPLNYWYYTFCLMILTNEADTIHQHLFSLNWYEYGVIKFMAVAFTTRLPLLSFDSR